MPHFPHKYYAAENKRHRIAANSVMYTVRDVQEVCSMLFEHFKVEPIDIMAKYHWAEAYSYYEGAVDQRCIVFSMGMFNKSHVYEYFNITMLEVIHEVAHYVHHHELKFKNPKGTKAHGKRHSELVDEGVTFLNLWGYWGRIK